MQHSVSHKSKRPKYLLIIRPILMIFLSFSPLVLITTTKKTHTELFFNVASITRTRIYTTTTKEQHNLFYIIVWFFLLYFVCLVLVCCCCTLSFFIFFCSFWWVEQFKQYIYYIFLYLYIICSTWVSHSSAHSLLLHSGSETVDNELPLLTIYKTQQLFSVYTFYYCYYLLWLLFVVVFTPPYL